MPTNEIPAFRSRRRLRTPETSKAVTAATDKENKLTSSNRMRTTPKAMAAVNQNNKNKAPDQSSHPRDDSLKHFQVAQSSTISADFWSDHPGLDECVVRASLSLGNDEFGKVHLHQNAVALLHTCRGLIKEAAEIKNDPASQINHLLVAAHGLRAIGPIYSSDVAKQETVIKLLYHLVITAADIVQDEHSNLRAAVLSLAGYQVLGHILSQYSGQQRVNGRLIGFESLQNDSDSILSHAFAVPVAVAHESAQGHMPLQQISTIALKTTFAMATVLSVLWRSSSELQPTSDQFTHEFGLFVHRLTCHALDSQHPPYHVMVRLLQTVALPWISLILDSPEMESVDDALSKCKKAHHVLWHAASQFGEASNGAHGKEEIQRLVLELRGHAILSLLPCSNAGERVNALLGQKHLEMACTCARKAAASYVQLVGIKSLPVEQGSALYSFHEQVGTRLQSVVSSIALPFYYVEYCAFQALHIGTCIGVASSGVTDCFMEISPSCLSCNDEAKYNTVLNRVALALFLLGVFVKGKITSCLAGKASTDDFCRSNASMVSHSELIVKHFHFMFIKSFERVPHDTLIKYVKLWTRLSLHLTLFRIQNEKPNGMQAETAVAATLLSKCVGPLYHRFLSTGTLTKSEIFQNFELMVECYIRSATSLVWLAIDSSADDRRYHLDRSNDAIRQLQSALLSNVKMVPQPILEKVAKVSSRSGNLCEL
jgi:hypothetical protein